MRRQLILPFVIIAGLIVMIGCGVSQDEYKRVQNEKSAAQIIAGIFAAGTVLALIFGTALGSKARHDAQR